MKIREGKSNIKNVARTKVIVKQQVISENKIFLRQSWVFSLLSKNIYSIISFHYGLFTKESFMKVKKKVSFRFFFITFIFFTFLINTVQANEPSPPKYLTSRAKTVIVTAQRSPTDEHNIAENVSVITQTDIAQTSARDLGEVLAKFPAVDVQMNGQFGQATALSINGSDARQVLLMIDGIPFNTQLSGQANPSQIPIEHIERIEVIKGASSSVWGSSLGGVINVITKDVGSSTTPEGLLTTSFAEFGTTKNSLELAGKIGEVGYLFTGSHMNTNGPQFISDAEEKKFFSKLQLPFSDEVKVTSSFGYNEADTRYALTGSTRVTEQPYHTRYGKIQLEGDHNDSHWELAWKYNHQDITTDINNLTTGSLISSTVSSNVYQGISLTGDVDLLEYGVLAMGADFDWHTLKSNRFLDSSKTIAMQAPYVNHTFFWEQWDFISGIRFDNNEHFGSQLSPSFGVVYHMEDPHETIVRAKISRGFNAPPLLWIFNNDPSLFVGPNPDLKAERSLVYEVGMESKLFSRLNIGLNLYRADVKDGIALVFDSINSVFVQENFRKFRRQGGEFIFNYQVNQDLSFYGSAGFNDAENRATRQQVRNSGVARQRYTFGMKYQSENDFGVYLSGYYNRWSTAPTFEPNDRKPIFDLKLTKLFDNIREGVDLEAFFVIHNLTNSNYWAVNSFPLARRYFEGGVLVAF